ncbi:MAG TPA: DUF222 domain-containing protein [Acidimicrobiales bacterium]|nr:DUF222 domain-containing protein [Acidimicrobiales bacterium]
MGRSLAEELVEVLAVDVESLSVAESVVHMARVEQVRTRFEAQVYETLGMFDRSGAWQLDAAYNVANWLAAQTGTSRAVAGSRVQLANRLQQMSHTREALAEGSITEAHARVLARCVANPRVRGAFADQEVDLVVQAMGCTADQLAVKVDAWIELWDMDGVEPRDPQHDTLSASRVGDRVRLNGDFGLDAGLPLLAALEERVDQLFHRDKKVTEANPDDGLASRTPGMRRAEALGELVEAGAAGEGNPDRREPLFMVHVDEDTYRFGGRHADSLCELTDGTVLPIDVMRRMRCGSRYQSVVLDAAGVMLFFGREERYANRQLRRALAARDRGCAVPGCDRPPAHCDAHHVVFWDYLGGTDIDNMVFLCRHHHNAIHSGVLSVLMVDGMPLFLDRYGNELGSGRRRPPPEAVAA